MTASSDSTKAAVVDRKLRYKKINQDTPRGQSMIVASRSAGVANVGKIGTRETFYTHWFPLPVFDDEEDAVQ